MKLLENKFNLRDHGQTTAQPPAPKKYQCLYAKVEVPETITQAAKALVGTLEAVLLNDKIELIERLPVSQLAEKPQVGGVDTIDLMVS